MIMEMPVVVEVIVEAKIKKLERFCNKKKITVVVVAFEVSNPQYFPGSRAW
jgi:hypothetical protein